MRPYVRTTPESRQRICGLYKAGNTLPQIAAETGFSKATVSNVVSAAGITGSGRRHGVRTGPETEALVVSLYKQGSTWREIMERTGITEHTVSAIIKRNGAEIGRKRSLNPDDWGRVADLYQDGMDAPAIGRELGCHASMIYYVLDRLGLGRRQQVACDNPRYFDEIDTPEKAYWLGFLGADGCVTGAKYLRLQVKLARKDRDHLELLHQALKCHRPVRDHEAISHGQIRPYSTLAVYSPVLARGLISHGITPRKTDALQPWDGPEHLMPHYWRGLIDGDGSITINDSGVYLQLLGSKDVAHAFATWANQVCGSNVTATWKRQTKSAWCVQVGGSRRILRLLAALYDDAPVALARKKALADLAVHGKSLQATIF